MKRFIALFALLAGLVVGVPTANASTTSPSYPGDAVCATHKDASGRYVWLESQYPASIAKAVKAGVAPDGLAVKTGVTSNVTFAFSPAGFITGINRTWTWTQGEFGVSGNGTPVREITRDVSTYGPWGPFTLTANDTYSWWGPNVTACNGPWVEHTVTGTLAYARAHGFPA